jgi:hypothetical protein
MVVMAHVSRMFPVIATFSMVVTISISRSSPIVWMIPTAPEDTTGGSEQDDGTC